MIVEKFTNLFRKKEESARQERAEKSRIKEETKDVEDIFGETMRNLDSVLRDIKDKEGHG